MTYIPDEDARPSDHARGNAAEELAYRLRQQALTAQYGLFALRTHDTPALLQEASRLCASGLQTEFCKVMEYLPAENQFIVRAGVGWKPGVVGHGRAGADLESPAGFAFQTGRPVISNHLAGETRFRTPEILLEHGVRRAINVLIRGDGDRFGILEVDSRDEGRFTEADLAFLEAFANVIGVAIERHEVEEALRANEIRLEKAVTRQNMLTREMSHRVKNSLTMVAGLLDMQGKGSSQPSLQAALQDAKTRVNAIAQFHDWLWRSDDVRSVDLAGFMDDLCRQLQFGATGDHTLVWEVVPIALSADLAVPLALLVNELVTNAFKYAYPDAAGEVLVRLTEPKRGTLKLEVSDKGIGVPADIATGRRTSLGVRLITTLSGQLGGSAQWEEAEVGTRFVVEFPEQ